MTESRQPSRASTAAGQPTGDAAARAARDGTLSRLAGAGRWAGERHRGRGWEDYLAEFLAAIFTWTGIGWLVDRWLDTGPWFMIAGVVLGNSLGIYLLWLRSDPERAKAAAGGPDDDRDPA